MQRDCLASGRIVWSCCALASLERRKQAPLPVHLPFSESIGATASLRRGTWCWHLRICNLHLKSGRLGLKRYPMRSASRSEEHTSELQSHLNLVCRLLLEKKKNGRYPDLDANAS